MLVDEFCTSLICYHAASICMQSVRKVVKKISIHGAFRGKDRNRVHSSAEHAEAKTETEFGHTDSELSLTDGSDIESVATHVRQPGERRLEKAVISFNKHKSNLEDLKRALKTAKEQGLDPDNTIYKSAQLLISSMGAEIKEFSIETTGCGRG